MKRLFNTNYSHRSLDIALLILRISIAALMLTHGSEKIYLLTAGGGVTFPDPLGVSPTVSLMLVIFAEVFCSMCVLVGFATRLAVLPLIFNMLIIIFVVMGHAGLEKQEAGLHYLLVYVVLLLAGSGAFSIDRIISRKSARRRRGY
ncbi:DoxX family protein [Pedobacter sp. L105]|uniref:DoxX family protein n=1 Tax=Pedobacter sp. L105 TaxID=1641871 RepID=UPI00131D675F|nr:DoxX family protein [Pedobacter sp. L105]